MSTQRVRPLILVFAALLVLAAAACGPATQVAPATQAAAGTPQVEVRTTTIVETVVVPQDRVVTATPPPATAPPDVEQTFTVAVGRDSGVLNPHDYKSNFPALTMVYEPLVKYASDGAIQPALAESWDISDDGLTWTFHLRQGVTFSDGTPFNAEAAKWNLERWVGVERHGWLPTTTKVASIETPDEYTLVLTMSEFYYPAIQDLALVRPVRFLSPSAVNAAGEFTQPIGTGPWKVGEHVVDQRTVFVPNETYWGTKPTLSKVVFEVIPDAQTRIAALLSGEVDLIGGEYIGGISLESIPVLQRNPNVQVLTAPGSTSYILMVAFDRAPFNDAKVRQALNYAINREAISSQIFRGIAAPAQGMFPANVPYVNYPHPELYAFNPDQAKALLAEAGWTAGADGVLQKDGKPFEANLVVDSNVFPQAKAMAEVIQAQLKDVGIKVTISLLDYGGWSEAVQNGNYDMAINITWGSPYDPHSTLTGLFHSGIVGAEGTIFNDPALDPLIDQALQTRDEAERQQKYDAVWNFLDENAAAIPVVYSGRFYALRKGVEGFNLAGTEYELELNSVTIGSD